MASVSLMLLMIVQSGAATLVSLEVGVTTDRSGWSRRAPEPKAVIVRKMNLIGLFFVGVLCLHVGIPREVAAVVFVNCL